MKLLVLDSNSILNRAFYGIRPLTTKDGVHTNAIYGFLNILLKLTEEIAPDAVACAFDMRAPTFRHEMYDGYKAQRKGMPEELAMQLPYIKEILTALGYRVIGIEGYEADDILGTLAKACETAGQDCVIATGDRDSLQLVSQHINVRLATTKQGKPDSQIYDIPAIQEKYGILPAQLIDVKALMGDTSDNIPGVAGIGEKTALGLIAAFGSLSGVYENIDSPEIKAGVRQKLIGGKESALMSYKLAEINCCVPMETAPDHYRLLPADYPKAGELFRRLELKTMAARFHIESDVTAVPVQQSSTPKKQLTVTLDPPVKRLEQQLAAEEAVCVVFDFEGDVPTAFCLPAGDELLLYRIETLEFRQAFSLVSSNFSKVSTNQSKRLYRYLYALGESPVLVAFDLELGAYLLSASSSEYAIDGLCSVYGIAGGKLPPIELPARQMQLLGDAARFPALCVALKEKLAESKQEYLLHEVEMPLARVLASMEHLGFELDTQGLRAYGDKLTQSLETLQLDIYEQAGQEFNINSPKQLGEILFGKLGLPARKKTKSGYSTNAEVLEFLRDKHPIIGCILEYRRLAKLNSTYVEGLLKTVGTDGRVHSTFQQTETRTGRISSTEPNMQNIPIRTPQGSRLRQYFRAKEGCMLIDADYSQIELRVLAHIAKDKNMIAAFEDGEDIHTTTASQVFGLPPLMITPIMRSRAKAVNFGIVYGIGAFSLSQDIGVSVAEADSYIKGYLQNFQGVKQYMEDTIAFGRDHGYVETLYHRRRYLPELTASNKVTKAFGERVAMNTPIQGTAADIIKIAMVRVFERLKAEKLKSRLILQIHDELLIEAPNDEAVLAQTILMQEMEQAGKLAVPLDVDVNSGANWLDAK